MRGKDEQKRMKVCELWDQERAKAENKYLSTTALLFKICAFADVSYPLAKSALVESGRL